MSLVQDLTRKREERGSLFEKQKKIQEAASAEDRAWTSEEAAEWDRIEERDKQLREEIRRGDSMLERERELARTADTRDRETDPENRGGKDDKITPEMRNQALQAWCLRGSRGKTPAASIEAAGRLGLDLGSNELQLRLGKRPPLTVTEANEMRKKGGEYRQQSVGTDTEGGFLVPDEMMREIDIALLFFGGVRRAGSTVLRTATGADLPIPTTDDTSNKGELLTENTNAADQDIVFGQVVLKSFKYSSKVVKVSIELMQDSATDMASLVGRLLGERIGRITNEHFTSGTGTTLPHGVAEQAPAGPVVDNTVGGGLDYPKIVDIEHSIDPSYREQGAGWMMHDNTIADIKKLVDLDGRPLWQPSLIVGEPDRLMGYPMTANNEMDVFADSAAHYITFGLFSKYYVRDVMDITLMRLNELFAQAGQVGFLAFSRHDGQLVDAGTNPIKTSAVAAT